MSKETCNRYGFIPANPDAKILWLPIATGQTLAAGDPVILSSGQVAVAVSNSSTELLGVVAQDCASLTAGTLVPVYHRSECEFIVRASTAPSSATVGTGYDITGTTGAFQLNVGATSQALCCLLGTVPGETTSNAGCLCRVKIVEHALADLST